jgi:hypothetical protein
MTERDDLPKTDPVERSEDGPGLTPGTVEEPIDPGDLSDARVAQPGEDPPDEDALG